MDRWEHGLDALDFSNYVAVNRSLISRYGLHVAVMVGELASEARYWSQKGELDDGWFFSTVENVEERTGLTAYFQREALKVMQDAGIVEVGYRGLPRKRYIRLHADAIIEAMEPLTASREEPLPLEDNSLDANNNKEELETKESKKDSYDSIVDAFTDSEELREAIFGYIKMRKMSKRPMTNRALKILLSKLGRLSSSLQEQVAILDNATLHNWQSVYPLGECNREGGGDVKEYLREYDFGCDDESGSSPSVHGSGTSGGPAERSLPLW